LNPRNKSAHLPPPVSHVHMRTCHWPRDTSWVECESPMCTWETVAALIAGALRCSKRDDPLDPEREIEQGGRPP
jgi:hypothetical protein